MIIIIVAVVYAVFIVVIIIISQLCFIWYFVRTKQGFFAVQIFGRLPISLSAEGSEVEWTLGYARQELWNQSPKRITESELFRRMRFYRKKQNNKKTCRWKKKREYREKKKKMVKSNAKGKKWSTNKWQTHCFKETMWKYVEKKEIKKHVLDQNRDGLTES